MARMAFSASNSFVRAFALFMAALLLHCFTADVEACGPGPGCCRAAVARYNVHRRYSSDRDGHGGGYRAIPPLPPPSPPYYAGSGAAFDPSGLSLVGSSNGLPPTSPYAPANKLLLVNAAEKQKSSMAQ